MPAQNDCLTADDLERFLLGQAPEEDTRRVQEHLGACQQCIETIAQLQPDDTLVRAMKAQRRAIGDQDEDAVARLVAYLSGLARPGGPDGVLSLAAPTDPADRATWPTVAGYEILGALGRGGMGVVYRARHLALRRIVALKMISARAYTEPEYRARFQVEVESIARLQHPHIVQIHEVGDANGQPYCALEFVEGGSLAQRLGGTPFTADQSAAIVETLARAMQAAHAGGVIHRDLNPSNVLLTTEGVPKITDFGLARRLDEARQTQVDAIMGTPSYMAPEQAEGRVDAIGPPADIYALGAILYECLTGRPPFRAATSLDTIHQVIRDDPVPPRQLQSKTPRDLETICLKCLHKDRGKRYASALELADDLHRFLNHQPIRARPVSRLERAARWCRRNKGTTAGLAAATLFLLMGSAVSIYYAIEKGRKERDAVAAARLADDARVEAQRAAEVSEAVTRFMVYDMLEAADPRKTRGRRLTVEEVLNNAAERVGSAFPEQPLVEAQVRGRIGMAYQHLGIVDKAEAQFVLALELLRRHAGDEHRETLTAMNNLANSWQYGNKLSDAADLYRKLLEVQARVLGDDDAATLTTRNNLGVLQRRQGKLTEAEATLKQVLASRRRVLGAAHSDTINTVNNLVTVLGMQERLDEAEPLAREVLAFRRRMQGNDDPITLMAIGNLARIMRSRGNLDEAESLFLEATETATRVLTAHHADTVNFTIGLALTRQDRGNYAGAEPLFRSALQARQATLPASHPDIAHSLAGLGWLLTEKGSAPDGEPLLRQALELHRAAKRTWETAYAQSLLGGCLVAQQRYAEAEPLLLAGYEVVKDHRLVSTKMKQDALKRVIRLYEGWAKEPQAAEWRVKLTEQNSAQPKPAEVPR